MKHQPSMSVAEIRKSFTDFFAARGHATVASSPLVPGEDPTLMFTNSGMVQFKDVFLGLDKRSYSRATSVQACLRAGGKHNDLENVGYTARHHTFFEMLGNWSFGDYFKRDSLAWGWELLTKVYGLDPERLLATVYHEDDEAYDIWTKEIGLPPERVIRIGDNKGARYASDNFWMMADTGPCGPCSEIFYDHGPEIPGGPPGSPGEDGDRFIEIWHHVFMQFDMQADGSLEKLPAPCVDTGMGLERLAAILQGVHSNYEIDLFQALIKAAGRETGCSDMGEKSLRVIADHVRAAAFLLADGVAPSSEGRGSVQRRIIRRAVRHGYKLGRGRPFLHLLVPDLVEQMGEAYPKLAEKKSAIMEAIKAEEARFFETLSSGMGLLDKALAGGALALPGQVAFKLHDTYGFPLDLTADICRERGVALDAEGFEEAMERQRSMGQAHGKFKMEKALSYSGEPGSFVGYKNLSLADACILALFGADGTPVQELRDGERGSAILSSTPFYAEGGGQAGDKGELRGPSGTMKIEGVAKERAGVFVHQGAASGLIKVGDAVEAHVDKDSRLATQRNHSATHLLHEALREVLGEHVEQKGSRVDELGARFDFSHGAALTAGQAREVEERVNKKILSNAQARTEEMSIDEARAKGAMMLFGEKYGERARVVELGTSVELCGGTHVERLGDIGLFKIIGQGGVASGVRRIEAATGMAALRLVQGAQDALASVAEAARSSVEEAPGRVAAMADRLKSAEREVAEMKAQVAGMKMAKLASEAVDLGEAKLVVAGMGEADAATLRAAIDRLKSDAPRIVAVLASSAGGKLQIALGASKDLASLVDCSELATHLAGEIGGKGGGRQDFAMVGGARSEDIPQALEKARAWIESTLAAKARPKLGRP